MIFPKALDRWDFIIFLEELRDLHQGERLFIWLDNLRVHLTQEVREYCDENDIELIFNVPYCSHLSPIEYVFAQVKRLYKDKKLVWGINYKKI
jgi:transposase